MLIKNTGGAAHPPTSVSPDFQTLTHNTWLFSLCSCIIKRMRKPSAKQRNTRSFTGRSAGPVQVNQQPVQTANSLPPLRPLSRVSWQPPLLLSPKIPRQLSLATWSITIMNIPQNTSHSIYHHYAAMVKCPLQSVRFIKTHNCSALITASYLKYRIDGVRKRINEPRHPLSNAAYPFWVAVR